MDESIFKNNLSTMKVSDGETEVEYHNVELIQQQEWADGTWYLVFREIPENEIRLKEIEDTLNVLLTGEVQ